MSINVVTFGCRLNYYESEIIRKNAKNAGMQDVIIINSCAVTSEAERQLRQSIRRLKRENPNYNIIVTGCAAQINPEKYANMEEVSKVIGNNEKLMEDQYNNMNLASVQSDNIKHFDKASVNFDKTSVKDIMDIKETAHQFVEGFEGKARGFLQVQNGCNHRCTFCIIPYGRGNSRSVPIGEIVNQAKILVDGGYNELVLTGVDMTDYGSDLPGRPTLGQMVRRLLHMVPKLPRLRLSSIDVAEIDDDLLNLISNEPRFMPHLHLSLQSGDDMILKRMKRRHSSKQIRDFCTLAKKLRYDSMKQDVVFGADIISGFPTETDEMFMNTYNLIKELKISHLHVFPYSAREGTPAAKMPQVEYIVRKDRAKKLRKLGEELLVAQYYAMVGNTYSAVIESKDSARTEDFSIINLKSKNNKIEDDYVINNIGNIVNIKVSQIVNKMLIGTII